MGDKTVRRRDQEFKQTVTNIVSKRNEMIRANKQQNHAQRHVGLVLTLFVLISADTPATGPIRPVSAQADASSWSYTGSLKWLHGGNTATLLTDGKVLVGGAPEELYDPSTGTWSGSGTLKVQRENYTATLLGNGKVLVAGGYDLSINSDDEAPELTNTAELYDPATGESHFTGNLNVRRVGHTAMLLPNGKVLFASGVTHGSVGDRIEEFTTNTAELYDPATGQWSLTGNLSTARYAHAAALLQNGKVLVAGGYLLERQDYTPSAEVYDPTTETWSSTGSLNTPRGYHTLTTLPNGNVLVSGGEGDVFPFIKKLNTAEFYNPATGVWSLTGNLSTARGHHTATLLSTGQVLVVGGITTGTGRSNSAELYDQATGTWNATASLNTARYNHSATLLNNGRVLVAGGGGERSAELYHPGVLDPDPTDPRILLASVSGKKLFITGENFHAGAVILLNGETQNTKQPAASPHTTLIGKKAGKRIKAGDKLQVRNPDGTLSEEFIFTGS
jgi:N-acetylneuraminic acid mutarotase